MAWGKTTKNMIKLLAVAVYVAVNNVSIKTKHLKNTKKPILIFVGVKPYFGIEYACYFQIHNGYHQTFSEYKTQSY